MQSKWLAVPTNKQEFMQLASDKMWRLHNLYYITDEHGKKTLFRPREAQLRFLLNRHNFDIILKARQLGFSTVVQLDMLDDCLFGKNENCGIIAQTKDDAEEIFATKIKFPYDNLPPFLRKLIIPVRDSRTAIEFSNGSKIRVGLSMRSSTLTNLHISEHGKICAKDALRAKEIKTGSLNTVHIGQKITIESTAEGREGDFYDFCKKAQELTSHSPLDFKFHFYPWYENPGYVLVDNVVISKELMKYFDGLEVTLDITLTRPQRNWYTKKESILQDDMKQEFPSTAKEAFEQAIDGAYFVNQMMQARKDGRIGHVPFDPAIPVNTFWDIGISKSDYCAIWFHQRVGLQNRFINYYENSGEHLPHYAKYLQEMGYVYGSHYFPHDAANKDFRQPGSVLNDAYELLKGEIYPVPRIPRKQEAINAVRGVFGSCWLDESQCALGITRLDNYRKEWNEHLSCWRDTPRHDEASHGTDAFMQFAQQYRVEDSEEEEDDWEEDFEDGRSTTTGY